MVRLEDIKSPAELRRIDADQLPALADEIRSFLIRNIARTGGHLGPNLGVVELTLAPTVGGIADFLAATRAKADHSAVDRSAAPGLFEDLGLRYIGPIDGHHTGAVEQALRDAGDHGGPVLVHAATEKGRGYVPARAGVTGPDGPSHHGMWDLVLLQSVPSVHVAAPRDAQRPREELREAVDIADAPSVLRYPKGELGPDIAALERLDDGIDVLAVPATGKALSGWRARRQRTSG